MKHEFTVELEDRILAFIAAYTAEHGYPPSLADIGAHIGRQKSVVFVHVSRLIADGRLVRTPGIARGLRVVDSIQRGAGRLAQAASITLEVNPGSILTLLDEVDRLRAEYDELDDWSDGLQKKIEEQAVEVDRLRAENAALKWAAAKYQQAMRGEPK